MRQPLSGAGRRFTEAAREAAAAAREAKRERPDRFGEPELFIVRAEGFGFGWELRRFGGVVLQRSAEVFAVAASAREAGEMALTILRATPGLPTFKRERQ